MTEATFILGAALIIAPWRPAAAQATQDDITTSSRFAGTCLAGGPTGPGIRPAAADCSNAEARKKALASAAPDSLVCGFREGEGRLQGGGIPMPTLADLLGIAAGRPVFDKTGVSGSFDVELKWRSAPDTVGDEVGIFTAVQEQLGLRLIGGEAPLDVIVIEKIERPTDN